MTLIAGYVSVRCKHGLESVVIAFSSIILVLTLYVMLLFHNYISESIEPDYQID